MQMAIHGPLGRVMCEANLIDVGQRSTDIVLRLQVVDGGVELAVGHCCVVCRQYAGLASAHPIWAGRVRRTHLATIIPISAHQSFCQPTLARATSSRRLLCNIPIPSPS